MKEILTLLTAISSISGVQMTDIGRDIQVEQRPVAEVQEYLAGAERDEMLWLARIIYSETKTTYEMKLVAWVARNRVESGYTGNTYEQVAKSKYQFSGLNSFDRNYRHNISIGYEDADSNERWKKALRSKLGHQKY